MAVYHVISRSGKFPPPIDGAMLSTFSFISANALKVQQAAVGSLKRITPVRSGYMQRAAASWGMRIFSTGGFTFRLGWRKMDFSGKAFYPPYVIYGTGVYGAKKTEIVPRTAGRLAWEYAGQWVSAKSVKGQPGQDLLNRATKKTQEHINVLIRQAHVHGFKKEM